MFLHCSPEDLDHDKRILDMLDASAPLTPKTDTDNSSSPATPKSLKKTRLPSSTSAGKKPPRGSQESSEHKPPASGEQSERTTPPTPLPDSDSDSDYSDPNEEYVKLKLRITDLTGPRRKANEAADNAVLKRFQARLDTVKDDYVFREKEAEAAFQVKRREADQAALLTRLRGEPGTKSEKAANSVPKATSSANKEPPSNPNGNAFNNDGSDSDSPCGFFELLEPMPTTETTDTGVVMTVRDMALPKHFTGRTSKTLFSEFVLKTDRYAVITYRGISGGSRAKRASLSVGWTGGRTNKWSMDDIACHDLAQAEQYIATVALHALTYPAEEGFHNSVGGVKTTQTTFRVRLTTLSLRDNRLLNEHPAPSPSLS